MGTEKKLKTLVILMADDDEDDRMMTQEALEQSRVLNDLQFVKDGQELLDYLRRENGFEDEELYPMPNIILLDLNMPRVDGRAALKLLKEDPDLRRIPVVILTTSKAEEDMLKGYDLGAASYITKPVGFEDLIQLMQILGSYWLEFVVLPDTK